MENIIMPLYKYIMHRNLEYCVLTSGHLSQTQGYDTLHSTHKEARMADSMEQHFTAQEVSNTLIHRGRKRCKEKKILLLPFFLHIFFYSTE